MSETMSNPSEWIQFYNQNFSSNTVFGDRISDATTVTTTIPTATATASTKAPLGSASSSPPANNLSPDGRVSKPVRKRSRASRRTPTTLLNTDTANFRAMVQQFTGGPSAPFASTGSHSSHPGLTNFNFGLGPPRQNFVNLGGSSGNFQVQAQQIYQEQQQQQQQQQQYMFGLNNSNSSINGTGGDGLFQRLSLRPNISSIGGGNEGFLNMEASTDHHINVSSQLLPGADRVSSNNSTIPRNENRNVNSFMF